MGLFYEGAGCFAVLWHLVMPSILCVSERTLR